MKSVQAREVSEPLHSGAKVPEDLKTAWEWGSVLGSLPCLHHDIIQRQPMTELPSMTWENKCLNELVSERQVTASIHDTKAQTASASDERY